MTKYWTMAAAVTLGCSALLLNAGCGAEALDARTTLPPGSTGGGNPASDNRFIVHEWGTYTSTVASTGAVLEGMQHEEEALPGFVHSRGDFAKGLEVLADGVTQKLETPVLYFYAPGELHVNVGVTFPQGLVSQWFPSARTYGPSVGSATKVLGGSMSWEADLVPGLGGFPTVSPTDIWEPSRHVASVPVRIGAEHEQFIFYRGVGTFSVPFRVTAGLGDTFSATNDSEDPVSALFLLRVHQGGGAIANLGALAAHGVREGIVPPVHGKEINPDKYVADASAQVAEALVQSGLRADEARAMVDTWSRSYFRSFGTRLLYIAPRSWTDKLLPITISPQPDELVRTLVGRVELLTMADEAELVSTVQEAAASATPASTLVNSLGRLAEPKLRRTVELLVDPTSKQYCTSAIAAAKMAK